MDSDTAKFSNILKIEMPIVVKKTNSTLEN